MENLTLNAELRTVSDKALEDLENMTTVYGLDALHDSVLAEMHRRPDFVPSSYDLQYLLEDLYGPIQFAN